MQQKNWQISILTLVALATLGLSLAAFRRNNAPAQTPEDTLSRIRKTGVIDACTVVYPPTVIKDAATGALSGHFVDALNSIAERIDAQVNCHESTSRNTAADLQSKRCDIVAAGYFANIPRAASIAFTKPPLFYIGESALVRRDDSRFQNVTSVYEFDKPDITVALATGESGDIFVQENFQHAKTTRIDVESADLTRFALEVSAGRADVAIADANTIALYAAEHPEVIDLFKDNPFGLNPVGWAVKQDDVRWLHFVETSLQFLDTQGILDQLEKKYNARWLHEIKQYELR